MGPHGEPDPEAEPPIAAPSIASPAVALPVEASPLVGAPSAELARVDFALDEFVVDDDDYPEASFAQRRVAPVASAPDRVDDIDDWLEEFAVSDGLDALPH